MSMGRRELPTQALMFVAVANLPASAQHPFYEMLNKALAAMDLDRRVEELCRVSIWMPRACRAFRRGFVAPVRV